MIVIKIPKEIREYKEKLIFGLTARQVIAILFVAGICIPAYLFGRKYIGEDAASWLMILAAAPGVCYGWYQKNGMPFEKYFSAIAKKLFLYPHTTVFKTKNFFRTMQTKAEQEEEIGVNPKKMKKYREKATLERCFLMEEAEENKEDDFNIKDVDDFLITVKKPVNKNSSPKNDKDDKDGEKEKKTRKRRVRRSL